MSHTNVLPRPELRPDAYPLHEVMARTGLDQEAFRGIVDTLGDLDITSPEMVEPLARRAMVKRYSANDDGNQRWITL